MATPKGMSASDQGEAAALAALTLCNAVGLLTAELLAGWQWPGADFGRKYAEALLRRLAKRGDLLPRRLDGRATAYVLTAQGAARIPGGVPGTSWGKIRRGQPWMPPDSLGHDLRAARFLVWLRRSWSGAAVWFDRELRRLNSAALKHPDGLATWHNPKGRRVCAVIECEGARRNAAALKLLAGMMVDRFTGQAGQVMVAQGEAQTPRLTVLVLPPPSYRDRRGYAVDHLPPIIAELRRQALGEPVGFVLAREQAAGGYAVSFERVEP